MWSPFKDGKFARVLRLVLSFVVGAALIGAAIWFILARVEGNVGWATVGLAALFAVPGIRLMFPERSKALIIEAISAWRGAHGDAEWEDSVKVMRRRGSDSGGTSLKTDL